MSALQEILLKRFLHIFIVIALLAAPSLAADVRAQEEQTIVRVALSENPPKIYTDDAGQVVGFWPELLDYIAGQEGWIIEYVPGTFDEGLTRLENGEVDIITDIAFSAERSLRFEFTSETAFINWAAVYVRPGSRVESFGDFADKRIAVLDEDIHFTGPLGISSLMEAFELEAEYLRLQSYEDVIESVERGDADIAVVNRLFGDFIGSNYNVEQTSLVFNPVELKFALNKDDQDTPVMIETIDKHIRSLKSDPESVYYESIIDELRLNIQQVEVEPDWIRPLAIASVILIVIALIYIMVARRYGLSMQAQAEKTSSKLKESETRYQELSDLLPQTIFEADNECYLTYVNDYIEPLFGYTKEELLDGHKLCDLFADEASKEVARQTPASARIENRQLTARKKDGTEFPVILFSAPIEVNGVIVGARGIIADISAQKKVEKELADKVGELEELTQTMIGRELKMKELKMQLEKEQEKDEDNQSATDADSQTPQDTKS
ncbi:MAG: Bacterial extracellular solute-binding protein, family 3 [candidate division WS6 bacterium OLB20]|uniref:Bacterial extracellular solute-binding protein, family 3 n=1 Tax=candidate division WS6 bacterium OLB20 TaxID=1617426 RepID=A0A136LWM2_9BACT|nr:MAG: Bacterial extracellular solute-binding protein, family 3 [candidate division WS6 bacterium OLB20]